MEPAAPPTSPAQRAAQFAAIGFALALPTVATFVYFILLSGNPATKGVYTASKVVQFAFPLVWVGLVQRRKIGFGKPRLTGVGAGGLLGIAVLTAMLGLYYGRLRSSPVLADVPRAIAEQLADFGIESIASFLMLAGFLSLIHSLAEEYYWRWFVFGQLRESLPLAAAIAISSLGFMAHHVLVIGKFLGGYGPYTWFFAFCVAIGGGLWAFLYHRAGTLYGAWLSHLMVDAGLMWIGYDLWQRSSAAM